MIFSKTYVRTDQYGVLRVGETRVSLDSVVYAFQQGHSAEAINEQYSLLSLEEVYGAIAFYLANREEVRQYLERMEKLWDEKQREAEKNPSPLLERFRALKAAKLQENDEPASISARSRF